MIRLLFYLVSLCCFAGVGGLFYLFLAAPEPRRIGLSETDGDAVRGTYIAHMAGCIGCYTDSKGGGALLAGGAAIETPFGVFYGPNITPDERTGLGRWTLQDFSDAMTAGQKPDGRRLYPVFPYTAYTRLTDRDLADLWAALKTVPAVTDRTRPHRLNALIDQRAFLIPWQTLFLTPGPFEPDPDRSEAWNRGAYIVEGPGHCGACHTPRNLLGGLEKSRPLAGSEGSGGEKVPAITAAILKAEGWTAADIVTALRTGLTPDGDVLGGSMGAVVHGSTQHLTDEDRQAIATYLLND